MAKLTDNQVDALSLVLQYNTGRGNRGLKVAEAPGSFRRTILALISKGFVTRRKTFVGRATRPTEFFVPTREGRKALASIGA